MAMHIERGPALARALLDLAIGAGSLLLAYALAARGIPVELSRGVPPLDQYLYALPMVLGVFLYTALLFRLYRPRRAGSYGQLALDLLKVNLQTALIVLAAFFFYRDFFFSRQIMSTFFLLNPVLLFLHHVAWMAIERHLHRRGVGTLNCLVVGCGELAAALAQRLDSHPGCGLAIRGFVSVGSTEPVVVPAERILGPIEDLAEWIERHRIQEVIVAVPFSLTKVLAEIDEFLAQTTVGLQWVPDLGAVRTLRQETVDLDGVQLINLRGVRTLGLSLVVKRSVDLALSLVLLLPLAPVMFVIAGLIRLIDGRPILYRQERVGLGGRVFTLYKFRTMRVDAERDTGPVWAEQDDRRATSIGAFLRRTSLDELPQLWNVLLGQMSLVGPRPERPVFTETFKKTVPSYMLRHRMKAGVTGWAQINGWRGNTSLDKRTQFDLYYVRNWTVWFDLKILALTCLRGWGRRRNAY